MRRSIPLDERADRVLLTNDLGGYAVIDRPTFGKLEEQRLSPAHPRYRDLQARSLLTREQNDIHDLDRSAYATRKAFALEGPSLHIFVVTLRCDHSCQYCQVSRAAIGAAGFDMSRAHAAQALERVFESPSPSLTIEFQGGEPALRFDLVREIVELAEARNVAESRQLGFSMVSTLHHLTDEDMGFCRDHGIRLSTSIDGPSELHDRNRPNPTRDSWARTMDGLRRAQDIIGEDAVSALPPSPERPSPIPERSSIIIGNSDSPRSSCDP